jgi:hypothetical protein
MGQVAWRVDGEVRTVHGAVEGPQWVAWASLP